jgi:hypothetical protein
VEIHIDRLDRRQLRRRRAIKADVAREAIGLGEQAVFVAIGFGAEFGRQILRSPGHADQAFAHVAVGASRE